MSLELRPPIHPSGGGGVRLPASALELAKVWQPVLVSVCVASLFLGLGLRIGSRGSAAVPAGLYQILDWAGIVAWICGPLLAQAADRLRLAQARQPLQVNAGQWPLILLGETLTLWLAAISLALAQLGLLVAFAGSAELLAYHDAEMRLFSIRLGPTVLIILTLGCAPLTIVSGLVYSLLRRLGTGAAAFCWCALSVLIVSVPAGLGWVAWPDLPAWLQIYPGKIAELAVKEASEASAKYAYNLELVRQALDGALLRLVVTIFGGLLLVLGSRLCRPAAESRSLDWRLPGWAAVLMPAVCVLPAWWSLALGNHSLPLPATIPTCGAGLLAGWTAWLLVALGMVARGQVRTGVGLSQILAPPLAWGILGTPLVLQGSLDHGLLLATLLAAASLWLLGLAVLNLVLQVALRCPPERAWVCLAIAGAAFLAALSLPIWVGGHSIAALALSGTVAAAESSQWPAIIIVCTTCWILGIWALFRRRPAPRPKVRPGRADTQG